LIRLFLLGGINYFENNKEKVATDIPVIPFSYLDKINGVYFTSVSNLFYWYTGKLSCIRTYPKKFELGSVEKVILKIFDQGYVFNSIEEIRINSGGVLLLGSYISEMKNSMVTIYGVYLDQESVHLDLIIKVEGIKTTLLSAEAVSIAFASNKKLFVEMNVEEWFEEKKESKKQ
jgi:hypothetical protein